MGEDSRRALSREMLEEMGVAVHVERLLWVAVNFFQYGNRDWHELGFYYLVHLPASASHLTQVKSFCGKEGRLHLVFEWFSVEAAQSLALYPAFLRNRLSSLPASVEHVVHTDGCK